MQQRKYRDVLQPAIGARASGASRNSDVSQPARSSTYISRSSGVTQPAGVEIPSKISEPLVQGVLEKIDARRGKFVVKAHRKSFEPLPELNKARTEEMRSKSFGPTLNSLQRAYSKLLHENIENEWSSEISGNVRDLAAAIVWKLSVKSEEAAEEGRELMIKMLEHLQVEFKWEKL